jgi:hypothetical protein
MGGVSLPPLTPESLIELHEYLLRCQPTTVQRGLYAQCERARGFFGGPKQVELVWPSLIMALRLTQWPVASKREPVVLFFEEPAQRKGWLKTTLSEQVKSIAADLDVFADEKISGDTKAGLTEAYEALEFCGLSGPMSAEKEEPERWVAFTIQGASSFFPDWFSSRLVRP